MTPHEINHNITADDKELLVIPVSKPNISLVFLQTNLNATIKINFHWSNDGINKIPLTDSNGDVISLDITASAASSTGLMLSEFVGKNLHISIAKQTATVGILTVIQSNIQ